MEENIIKLENRLSNSETDVKSAKETHRNGKSRFSLEL